MDPDQAPGMGDWNAAAAFDHWPTQYTDGPLGFDAHQAPEHGQYGNEQFLAADNPLNAQVSSVESQSGAFQPFFYNTSEVWPGSGQTGSAYPHEQSIQSVPQTYYPPPQQHGQQAVSNGHPTVDSRFALSDMAQGHEYQAHLQSSDVPDTSHGFSNGIHTPSAAPNGYMQSSVSQWQGGAQIPVSGFAPEQQQYQNPLAQAQSAVSLQAQTQTGSPSPYSSAHIPQGYHQNTHHQANKQTQQHQPQRQQQTQLQTQPQQQQQTQFVSLPNGQQQQFQTPARAAAVQQQQQHQVGQLSRTDSPRSMAQHTQARVPQPITRPAGVNSVSTQDTGLTVALAPANGLEPQAPQQKRRVPGESSEVAKISTKKARVVATGGTGSVDSPGREPPADPPVGPRSTRTLPAVNTALRERVLAEDGSTTWPGVGNLVVGGPPPASEKKKGIRGALLLANQDFERPPLFPDLPGGWTLAETIGRYIRLYNDNKSSETDKQRADIRLDTELDRLGQGRPANLFGVDNKPKPTKPKINVPQATPPAEPLKTAILAQEKVRIHPAHRSNNSVRKAAMDAFHELIKKLVKELRECPAYEKIGKLAGSGKPELQTLRDQVKPFFDRLEAALNNGIEAADASILRQLGETSDVPGRLSNVVIRLANTGEGASSLVKAIICLYGKFTAVKPSTLASWKFPGIAKKLRGLGDAELDGLLAIVEANAAKNKHLDDAEPSPKKARVPSGNKRAREEDDAASSEIRSGKKLATEIGAKPSPSSAATRPLPAASKHSVQPSSLSGSTKPPATVASSAAAKQSAGPTKPSASSASLAARKDSSQSANSSSSSTLPKQSSAPPALAKQIQSSTIGTSANSSSSAAATPKRTLLLPGKVRIPAKPVAKQEPVKTEVSSSSQTAPKPESTRTGPSKLQAALRAPEPSGTSKLGQLLADISAPKKVTAPEPPKPVTVPIPAETPEERKIRLRKESRRHLRVVWKGDDRLAEVREFDRWPGELEEMHRHFRSLGPGDQTEGMALRSNQESTQRELHALEAAEWPALKLIDFDALPEKKRQENYSTRGGTKTFHTDEQKFHEDRFGTVMMVVYPNPNDIPPTPKSPQYEPELFMDESARTSYVPQSREIEGTDEASGRLKDGLDEYHLRAQQSIHFGRRRAMELARDRLGLESRPTRDIRPAYNFAHAYGSAARDQQTLDLLTSDRAKRYVDPDAYDPAHPKTTRRFDYPQPTQTDIDAVEKLFEAFKDMGRTNRARAEEERRAQEQAQQQAQEQAQRQAQQQALQNLQRFVNPYSQIQAQAQPVPAQPVQPQPAPDPAANQLQAVLSALAQSNAAAQAQQSLMATAAAPQPPVQPPIPTAPPAPTAGPEYTSYILSLLSQAQAASTTPVVSALVAAPQGSHGQSGYGQTSYSQSGYAQGSYTQSGYGQGGYSIRGQDQDGDGERNRDRNRSDRGDYRGGRGNGYGGRGNGNGNSNRRDGADVPDHLRGINTSLIGTKQCTFYLRGQCAKGQNCTFRH